MSFLDRVAGGLRARALTLLSAGALLAYVLWTVSSSGDPFSFQPHDGSYYNLLGNAFLAGKLHLLVEPAPQLLRLPNPYDPTANAPYQLHDAALYHGHYYLTWGPVPVLLLYLPFRLLSLGDMSDPLAAGIFAFVGLCFAIALLRYLTRRYLPNTPRWMLALGEVALVAGSALPFTLRRVLIYEVSIAAGYCFMFAGLYFLATGLLERPYRLRRLALSSLCLGLGAGSRQSIVLPAMLPLVVLLAILVRDRPETRRAMVKLALALVGPVALCGALLAAYNFLRFGSITEYGQNYQLAGVDTRQEVFGSFSYVLPGVWFYLFGRAHITAGFPFFHIAPPPSYPWMLPPRYTSIEPTAGLLTNVPLSILSLVSWLVLRHRRDRELRLATTTALLLGLLLVFLLSYSLWGATMRYEVDFATLLVIPSLLAWFALIRTRSRARRIAVSILGAAAVLWGTIFGLAIGLSGYFDSLLTAQPATFHFLEKLTSPIGVAIAAVEGDKPTIVRAEPLQNIAAEPNSPNLDGGSVSLDARPTTLVVVSPTSGTYRLVAGTTGGRLKPGRNLCTNSGFESGTQGWTGVAGDEVLTRVTTDHKSGAAALRVAIPNAPIRGVVYSTPKGQDIPAGASVETAVWMKGTPGAQLEMQVRIVNTDGSSSGTITSFTANGHWQHKSAVAAVNPGATGDIVQILALRRKPAGKSSFLVDGALAARLRSPTEVRLFEPGTRGKTVSLDEFAPGVPVHLGLGVNRISLAATAPNVSLQGITLHPSSG